VPPIVDPAVTETGFFDVPIANAWRVEDVQAEVLEGHGKVAGFVTTLEGAALRLDLSAAKDGEPTHILVRTADGPRTDLWDSTPFRSRSLRVVRRMPRMEIVPIPAIALFFGERKEARIEFENRGNAPAALSPPRLPFGYELADPREGGGFVLAPGQRHALTVRCLGTTEGELRLVTEDGQDAATVKLLPAPAPPVRTPPGFVVSVDFGTSNTSVFCLETRTGAVEAVPLARDGQMRRETALYAPEDVDPRYWQAVDVRGVHPHKVLRNLKTLVREKAEGSQVRLEFYLRSLLRNGIEVYLQEKNPEDESPVEFVFTIPVLDGEDGEAHRAYRETLLRAIRAAGYEDEARGRSVRTMLEPDGGALDVLAHPEHGVRFTDGDRLLIVDVGGGTTDVTLGRLRLTGGRPRLEEAENVSVRFDHEQFGGEMATYMLGWRWVVADAIGRVPMGPENTAARNAHERIKTKNLVDYGWLADESRRAEAEKWVNFDRSYRHPAPDNWERRFTDLWVQIRNAKHFLSDESARRAAQPWTVPPYVFDSRRPGTDRMEWRVPIELLDTAIERAGNDMAHGIETFLKEREIDPREIAHVAMIGGSARLEPIRRAIARLFPGKLLPLGDYVDVAVCRGAARLHQAPPPLLPVGFEMRVGETRIRLIEPGSAAGKVARKRRALQLPPGRSMEVAIDCVLPDGTTAPFLGFPLPDGFDGEIAGSVSSAGVRLAAENAKGTVKEVEAGLR